MSRTTIMLTEVSDLSGKSETRRFMIEEEIADLDIWDFRDSFIVPLLLAIGYGESSINKII